MKPVFWTPEARRRLRDIRDYIISQNAPNAAKKIIAILLSRTRQLEEAPLSGSKISDYPNNDLRELLERPYRIVYRVTETQIEIISVMHYRQLLPATVKELRNLHKN